ncbi:MAG TPA: urease accessory UreF family protein [Nocardioidaceae bacterium]
MVVTAVLGNVKDRDWAGRLERGHVDKLLLDQWEAQKGRLRKRTVAGVEVGLALRRGTRLSDGDILAWDEESATAIVAHIQLGDVMVIALSGLAAQPTSVALRSAIELGHAIGNQHWPAVVKDDQLYIPLTVDRAVMNSVMRTHDLIGISHQFLPGAEVIAFLAPHESRRLFGGANSTIHSHLPEPASREPETQRRVLCAPARPRGSMTPTPASINATTRILQFGDSMFPVGTFAFSGGLEAAVQQGVVKDRTDLAEFVETVAHLAATSDGIALLAAHRGAIDRDLARIRAADDAVYVRKLSEEARTMTVRMGRKLAEAAVRILDEPILDARLRESANDSVPVTYPVALGALFAALDLPEPDAFATHQYGVTTMVLGAAVRLMRIDHLECQEILYAVNATTADEYQRAAPASLDDMASFGPTIDVLAASHVHAQVRMFMN